MAYVRRTGRAMVAGDVTTKLIEVAHPRPGHRRFPLAEKKHRPQDAQAYNALVLGWPEVARLASEDQPEQLSL